MRGTIGLGCLAALWICAAVTVATAQGPAPQGPAPQDAKKDEGGINLTGGVKLKLYGFARLDLIYDDSRPNDRQSPQWILRETPKPVPTGAVEKDDDILSIHPRLTRMGFDFAGPDVEKIWNARTSAKLEIDWQNRGADGRAESRPVPRFRHAYLNLSWDKVYLLAGQTWDIVSPLFPTANGDTLMWNTGNLGDRRPQLQLGCSADAGSGALSFLVGLGQTGAVDNQDLGTTGAVDGEDAGVPMLQGRIGYTFASPWVEKQKIAAGLWGHVAWEETDAPVGTEQEDDFRGHSWGLDLTLPVFDGMVLKGEGFQGENLDDVRGGIGQGINATSGDEIESRGGWVEAAWTTTDWYTLAFGMGADRPKSGDLADGARDKNSAFWLAQRFKLGGGLNLGLDYIRWTTEYKNVTPDDGEDNRFNLFLQWNF